MRFRFADYAETQAQIQVAGRVDLQHAQADSLAAFRGARQDLADHLAADAHALKFRQHFDIAQYYLAPALIDRKHAQILPAAHNNLAGKRRVVFHKIPALKIFIPAPGLLNIRF